MLSNQMGIILPVSRKKSARGREFITKKKEGFKGRKRKVIGKREH